MTDKEYNQTRRRLKRLCNEWIPALGFGWWKIIVEYHRGRFTGKWRNSVVRNRTLWQYRESTIIWNMPFAFTRSDEDLKEDLFHELAHILIAEMHEYTRSKKGRKHEEHVCCHIQNLILCACIKARKDAKAGLRKEKAHGKKGTRDG